MKMKYCPQCARMDMKRLQTGDHECIWCHYQGTPREGAIDEINAYKRNIKSGTCPAITPSAGTGIKTDISPGQLKQKLDSLKGKKTDDFEIL
ncbi:MAG: hypothetical protein V1777_01215 [Candidatus Micrarchaeota archaeon]